MTIKTSTGLRNGALASGSIKSQLDNGLVKIYGGPVPASADVALDPANTLLCTISSNSTGAGVTMAAAASDGVLPKTAAEIWSGVNAAGGTASFYRHVGPTDDASLSITQPRIQGQVAVFGSDLNLTSTTLAAGATQSLDFYSIALPTL